MRHKIKITLFIWKCCLCLLCTGMTDVCSAEDQTNTNRPSLFFLRQPPQYLYFSNATGARVDCQAGGNPPPTVTWVLSDGASVTNIQGLRQMFPNGTLAFSSFRATDYRVDVHAAAYKCIASSSAGVIVSRSTFIRAVVMQHYEVQVYDEFVISGNTAVLKCHVPSFISDFVTVTSWIKELNYHNAETVQSDNKYVVLATGKLHIRDVRDRDSLPTFRCQTTHRLTGENRLSSTSGRLMVTDAKGSVPPRITDMEAMVYSKEGDTVILPCAAQGHPVPHYRWTSRKNGNTMFTSGRIHQVGGNLVINNVQVEDSGTYECLTNNSVGAEKTETVLTVTASLSASINPQFQIVDIGRSATLTCITSGYPITSITWLKDGKPVAQTKDQSGGSRETVTLHSVTKEDRGMYQCFVTNDWETVEATAELHLGDSVPSFLETFQDHTLHQGPQVSMKCISSGTPMPQISWSVDGIALPKDSRYHISEFTDVSGNVVNMLNISNIRIEDGGQYKCSAKNRVGDVDYSAMLNVYGPPVIRLLPPLSIVAGHNLTLRCPVSGYPIETIEWQKEGKTIPLNKRQVVFTNGTLHIRTIQRNPDAGKYTCIVRTKEGHSAQKDFQIRVLIPPKIMPFSLQDGGVLHEGMRVQLFCAVTDGDLPIAIEWLKDGHSLPSLPEVTTNYLDKYASTLVISQVTERHTGNYTCVARNAAKTVTHTAPLNVHVPPKINPFTFQGRNLHEGTHARLVCGVFQGDLPLTFFWLKDGRAIVAGEERVVTREIDEFSSILTIKSATPWHNGNYSCIAKNEAGSVNFTTHLTVNVPPRWVVEPKDVSVVVAKQVALDCQAEGFPRPVVTWLRAVDNLPGEYRELNDIGARVFYFENGTLLVNDVQEGDEGKYLCQATNGIGTGLSIVVFLDVQVPARFDAKTANASAKRGSIAKLQCKATGDRPVDVNWSIRGQKLSSITDSRFHLEEYPTQFGMVSQLIIKQVERGDSAIYSCVATNFYGRDETFIKLAVQERPEPPMGIKVVDQSSRIAQVSWLKPYDGNTLIAHYVVQFKKVSGTWSEASTNITVPGTETTVTVQGLQPATSFHIRVFAENSVGSSDPSEAVVVTTTEEAPSGPPQDLQTKVINSQTVHVTWKPPKKDMWNGVIRGYHVGYRKTDSTEPFIYKTVESHNSGGNEHSVELNDLKKFTKYAIIVQAFNHIGSGPKSEEIELSTEEDVPSKPPLDVKCSPLSSQSLHVSWESPPLQTINGVLLGYKVVYKPAEEWYDTSQPEAKVTPASKTILHGLQKNTNYSVQVLAYTRAGDGERCSTVYCRTLEDVPDAPADVKAVIATHDSILVTWKEPLNSNGNVVKYTVYVRSSDHGKEDTVKHTVVGTTQFEASSLKRNTRYDFWITAATSVGEGQSTRVITQTINTPMVPAKIVSFDSEVVVPFNTEVELSCKTVGKPVPERLWKRDDRTVDQNERFHISKEGSLRINKVQVTDAGIYICIIQNSYGSDEVKYKVIIQVPPGPPSLGVISATHTSIVLNWKFGKENVDSIRGYTIHYKRDYGEWEMLRIKPDLTTFTLENLDCGARYQLYMSAFNKIGIGNPSEVIFTKTKGASPEGPPKYKLVRTNSTFVTLRLEAWSDGGCAILHFVVEYKLQDEESWRLVANNVHPGQTQFIIPDLKPATWYNLRVTAHNSAGSTTVEYDFATHTLTGDELIPNTMQNEENREEKVFLINLSLLAFVGAAAGIGILITLFACLCARRRLHPGRKIPSAEGLPPNVQTVELKPLQDPKFQKNLAMGSFTCLLRGSDHRKLSRHADIMQNNHHDVNHELLPEDVSPYATSQISGFKNDQGKLLLFPHRHYVPDLPPRNQNSEMTYSKVRKQQMQYCQRPDTTDFEKQDYDCSEDKDLIMCPELTDLSDTMPTLYALRPTAPVYGEHQVPDLLEHGPESSSTESSPESRRRTYPHYGSTGSRLVNRNIPTSPSVRHELRQLGDVKEIPFLLSPNHCYPNDLSSPAHSQWDILPMYSSDIEIKDFQRRRIETINAVSALQRYEDKVGFHQRKEEDFTIPV